MFNKRVAFKLYKDKDGNFVREDAKKEGFEEIAYAVRKPNHEQQRNANFLYAKYMNQYLKDGVMPQMRLEDTLKANGIWDEDADKKEKELVKVVQDVNEKLKRGGIKISEAAVKARESIKARYKLLEHSAKRNNLLNNSAENLAQNHKFNYLVSECTVYDTSDKRVFKDYDDFLKQDNQGSLLPYVAGENFSKLMYDFDEDFRKDWPEFKFLMKYKLVNDKLEFLDKDNNVVDIDGNKIEVPKEENKVETPEEPEFLPD